MTIAVKLLLTVALIFSIAVPFGAFAAGEKTKGRYKTALAANTVMFFGTMLFAVCVLFGGTAFAAESTAAAGGISTGMGYIAAALSTGLSCIGGDLQCCLLSGVFFMLIQDLFLISSIIRDCLLVFL